MWVAWTYFLLIAFVYKDSKLYEDFNKILLRTSASKNPDIRGWLYASNPYSLSRSIIVNELSYFNDILKLDISSLMVL